MIEARDRQRGIRERVKDVKHHMAKKVVGFIKLQIPAGQANPAPRRSVLRSVQQQVNIMQFCQAFNDATQDQMGTIIPVEITVYEDRSFDFITKTPPAAVLLKKAAGLEKGSGEPNREKVGHGHQGTGP